MGQLEVVKELADREAKLEATDDLGQTPMSVAFSRKDWVMVKELSARIVRF